MDFHLPFEGPYFFIGVTHYSYGEGALAHSTVQDAKAGSTVKAAITFRCSTKRAAIMRKQARP